jgi:Tfp pilus assembly protein PilN
MIEINLLPAELKSKSRKIAESFELKQILYLIPILFGVIIIIHIYLLAVLITKNSQISSLNNKWQQLGPQRKTLEDFREEYEGLSSDAAIIRQLVTSRIAWSKKLNRLSLDLPSGVWFNELLFRQKEFILKASTVSLQKEELTLINKFMENLKNDTDFFKDFSSLELGPVQRRTVGSYDIVDFDLQAKLK